MSDMRTILVTGAAGFIGSNFVRLLLTRGERVRLVAFDKLTYAGNLANLQDLLERYPDQLIFVRGDICDAAAVHEAIRAHGVSEIVHFAAESHVDRSIIGSGPFVQTNVIGTQVLLDAARATGVSKFVQISTDEVYGSLPEDRPELKFTEESPLATSSPYSATKAAADCLARSYQHTFGVPVVITRCGNNFGPYQFPEKLIPLFVTNLIEGQKVPLYGDGLNIRDWIYVEDHCDAIWTVLNSGRIGHVYNIGSNTEVTNRQITEMILHAMGRKWDESVQYVADRPGHDRRYALDASRIRRELGWEPKHRFEEALETTIRWYMENESWWRAVKSGEYRDYYERQYGQR